MEKQILRILFCIFIFTGLIAMTVQAADGEYKLTSPLPVQQTADTEDDYYYVSGSYNVDNAVDKATVDDNIKKCYIWTDFEEYNDMGLSGLTVSSYSSWNGKPTLNNNRVKAYFLPEILEKVDSRAIFTVKIPASQKLMRVFSNINGEAINSLKSYGLTGTYMRTDENHTISYNTAFGVVKIGNMLTGYPSGDVLSWSEDVLTSKFVLNKSSVTANADTSRSATTLPDGNTKSIYLYATAKDIGGTDLGAIYSGAQARITSVTVKSGEKAISGGVSVRTETSDGKSFVVLDLDDNIYDCIGNTDSVSLDLTLTVEHRNATADATVKYTLVRPQIEVGKKTTALNWVDVPINAFYKKDYVAKFAVTNSDIFRMPETVEIRWGGENGTKMTQGVDYAYDKSTGVVTVYAKSVTDTIYIQAAALRKETLTESSVTFTPPTNIGVGNIVYDGTGKTATVTVPEGAGAITVYYKAENGDWTTTVPTVAGTYQVKIDVAMSDTHLSATGLTDSSWKFTIAPISDEVTVVITGNSDSVKYDGSEKTVTGYEVTSISNPLYTDNDFTFSGNATVKGTDADTYSMELTSEDFSNKSGNFTNVTFVVADGTLTIGKRTVTLTSATDSKVYDTTALTNDKVNVGGDGFIQGEGATYSVTGTQTDVGSSDNEFTYTLSEGTNADNYDITTQNGTLTVTKATSNAITGLSIDDWTYGEEAKAPTASATFGEPSFSYEATGETVYSGTTPPTNAGTYKVIATVEDTSNYVGATAQKEFTILPKTINASISLTAPVAEAVPQTSIETDEYTATVEWTPTVTEKFEYETVYTAKVTVTPKVNYTFMGITENSYTVEGASVTNSADSGVLTAVFPKTDSEPYFIRYTVKFETNGGTKVADKTAVRNFKIPQPTAPEKEGYTFNGWYTDEELSEKYDFDKVVTKSFTLYAKWDKEDDGHEWKNPFSDVKENDWFYSDVQYVNEKGLMNGLTETAFAPNDNLTRAMLVTVLYRIEGEPATNKSIPFADVDANAYYSNALVWAHQNGIINGVSKTEFKPNDNITREQIATIIYRYAQYKGYDMSAGENTNILSYDDFAQISEYAIASMQYAAGSGLMKGKTNTTLNPKDNATRAEIASILHRFIEDISPIP